MFKVCSVNYLHKIHVSADDDLESALEDSNSETMLRKFFEGTSMRNVDHDSSFLCDYVTSDTFSHVITPSILSFFIHIYICENSRYLLKSLKTYYLEFSPGVQHFCKGLRYYFHVCNVTYQEIVQLLSQVILCIFEPLCHRM